MANIHVTFRTPEELVKRLDDEAKQLRRSRGSILTEIIEKYYDNSHAETLSRALHVKRTKKAGAR